MFGQAKYSTLVVLALGAICKVQASPLGTTGSIAHVDALDNIVTVDVGNPTDDITNKFFGSGSSRKRDILGVNVLPDAPDTAQIKALDDAVTASVGSDSQTTPSGSSRRSPLFDDDLANIADIEVADGKVASVKVGGGTQRRNILGIDLLDDTVDVEVGGDDKKDTTPTSPTKRFDPFFPFGPDDGTTSTVTVTVTATPTPSPTNPTTPGTNSKRFAKRQPPPPPGFGSDLTQDGHDPFANINDEGDDGYDDGYYPDGYYPPFPGFGNNNGPYGNNGPNGPNGPNGGPPFNGPNGQNGPNGPNGN